MYTKYLTLWPLGGPQCEPCEDFRDFAEFDRLCVANVGSWVRAEFGRLCVAIEVKMESTCWQLRHRPFQSLNSHRWVIDCAVKNLEILLFAAHAHKREQRFIFYRLFYFILNEPCDDFRDFAIFDRLCVARGESWCRSVSGG